MNDIKRDNAADLLKGFAIVLLVMSHVLQFSAEGIGLSYVIPGCSGIVELWARSFNMPLFFFVSGLLLGLKSTPNNWSGTGKAILHKMRTLLLPGVTFMLFRYVLSGKWEMEWFLKVLFAIITIFLFVRMIANRVNMHTPPPFARNRGDYAYVSISGMYWYFVYVEGRDSDAVGFSSRSSVIPVPCDGIFFYGHEW